MSMYAYFALKGISPDVIAGAGWLVRKFYMACMELEIEHKIEELKSLKNINREEGENED